MDMHLTMIKLREIALGQGSLACHGPWGLKELDMIEQLNNKNNSNNNPVSEETNPADTLIFQSPVVHSHLLKWEKGDVIS